MKTMIRVVGLSLLALSPMFAAGHGGGGFGGGGGGHFGGFGGGRPGARFSFGAAPVYGRPAFVVPHNRIGNSGMRFPSVGAQRNSFSPGVSRTPSSVTRSSSGLAHSRAISPTSVARSTQQPLENAKNHIFARQNGNSHRDWGRRGAHFWNGHWWAWDGGAWIGLEAGYYPWDYFPYYAYDYYPYDYYPGYYTNVEPYYESDGVSDNIPAPDPNVTAVQTDLAKLDYYHGSVDGLYGRATRDAVARYQSDHHLIVTGTLTTETLQALGITSGMPS